MFQGEEDCIWLFLFIFMVLMAITVLMAIMVLLTFKILLFSPPYGLGWNIRVLGWFFHHSFLDYLAGLLWCHQNSPTNGSSSPKALIPRDTLPTPQSTQMWVQIENNGRGRSRGTLLAHKTLRSRKACWSFRMGLGRVDKLHSFTRACTQPTQGG